MSYQSTVAVHLASLTRDVVFEPLPDGGVDLLGLLGRRRLARPNRPHRLVSQHHARPEGAIPCVR